MALRGKKPEEITKRLKAFFYGVSGVGKTMAAIQFPAPYVIDAERGAENSQYVDALKKNGGVIFQTTDFDDLILEVRSLLSEKHTYKTLVIDPLTIIYSNLLNSCADKLGKNGKDGTERGRHYLEAEKHMKRLLQLLMRLDMNVIITSHAKPEYAPGGEMTIIGTTFDCYKKLDYLFDLAIEVTKRGKVRKGLVKKTRIASFEEGELFDFCYAEIAKKYGKDVIEKEAAIQKLVSKEQLSKIYELVYYSPVTQETMDKTLNKAGVSCYEDLTEEQAQKIIDWLEPKCKKPVEETPIGFSETQLNIGEKVA